MTENERSILAQLIDKARDAAAGGLDALSTGEQLAAALVLNRADWLAERGYTIAEALDRLGPSWVAQLPAAAKQLAKDGTTVTEALQRASYAAAVDAVLTGETVCLDSQLVTYSLPNGNRDVSLTFDVRQAYADGPQRTARIELRLRPEDGEQVVRAVHDVHSAAWKYGQTPIDVKEGETRPKWIDGLEAGQ